MFEKEALINAIKNYSLNELIELKIKIRFEIFKIIEKQKDLKASPEHIERLKIMDKMYSDVFDRILDIVQGK